MSNFSEQKADIIQKMEWCFEAIKYLNENLDETHDLYEPVNDAYWLVQIAKKELRLLLESLEAEQSPPNMS
jgi:hypothetical protein